jgi:serine/threonine-protein kinase
MPDGDSDAPTSADTSATMPGAPPHASRLSLPGYDVGETIGRGGMGEVLLARDPEIGRDVAVKRIVADDPDPSLVARFIREAKIQARLEHPAIVPVHQIGRDAHGMPYFTMKRLAGTTLADVLRDPAADRPRMLRALVDVCNALELAHHTGVVHRDIKPANIMLGDFGEVYVLDWGIARVIADPELASSPGLVSDDTQVGAVLGTVGYMAPEQLRDATTVGPAADVYAVGCILFEILAGVPAHPRGAEALTSTLTKTVLSPAAQAPDRPIPPELDTACIAALAHEPASRPSARELGARIQRYLDGDRDLERRRELARHHLAIARDALAVPSRRAEATREAGRALALDPQSADAAELVTRLMIEPPKVLPPDLATHLDELDRRASVESSLEASKIMASFVLFFPLLLWTGIASWPWMIATIAGMLCAATLAYVLARTGKASDLVGLAYMGLLCVLVSRFAGVFVIVPGMLMISMMGLDQQAQLIPRPAVLIGVGMLGILAPLALEWLGVFAPTARFVDGRMLITSEILEIGGTATFVCLLIPNLMMVVAAGMFSRRLGVSRRDAIRRLEIQKWHFDRLLPGGT